MKNIARPVRVYRVRLGADTGSGAGAKAAAPAPGTIAAPDMPSIAVLPFENMSADPEQEYFADGMVEDIITDLSRYRNIFVIARNSTFTYKGRAVDVKQVGRELGVRYVLEGSVRKAGSRIRITGQLIDAATGMHLWADRFEGGIEDIFDLQDRVAASVVGAIVPQLRQAEIERARRKPTESLDAHIAFMRGLASFHRWGREAIDEALRLAHLAIELDPNYSTPYGLAASCYVVRKTGGWVSDPEREIADVVRLTTRAVAVGSDDAFTLASSGFAIANVLRDLDAGVALIDRALALNPSFSMGLTQSGYIRIWLGEPDLAIDHLERAMGLSPVDSLMFMMHSGMAFAHFTAGRYGEAFAWAEKALQRNPFISPATRIATASAALLGRAADAAKYLALLQQLDPGLRVSNLHERVNLRRPDDHARLADGLRKAGLPD